MTLQLFINGKLIIEQKYNHTNTHVAANTLRTRYGYALRNADWTIYAIFPSKGEQEENNWLKRPKMQRFPRTLKKTA